MIKYKTYISTTGRSSIFYFISNWDIIMLKVVVVFFLACPKSLFLIHSVNPTG
jgi:hypothetical protein